MSFDPLAYLFTPEVVAALDERIERVVDERLAEREREGREWLTCAQAAALLGCSPAALRERERTSKTLNASRVDGRLYFKHADIVDYLDGGMR